MNFRFIIVKIITVGAGRQYFKTVKSGPGFLNSEMLNYDSMGFFN